MNVDRRQFLAAAAVLSGSSALAATTVVDRKKRLGVVQYSYALRLAAERASGKTGLADPLAFLEHCHDLGAGGVQVGLGIRDSDYLATLHKKAEAYGMDL